MELKPLVDSAEKFAKELNRQLKAIKAIQMLDKDRQQNVVKIRGLLKGMNLSVLPAQMASLNQELEAWKGLYEREVEQEVEQEGRRIGIRLEGEFKNRGIQFAQKGPAISAGLFLIEWDLQKRVTTIWYGPQKEKMGSCGIDPVKIVEQVDSYRKSLGCSLSPEEFIERLRQAYCRVLQPGHDGYAALSQTLAELSFLLQEPVFFDEPTKENYRNYTRADFSFDLFRIRREAARHGLHLKTATLAATKRRQNFLWVPGSESVEGGDHYSEIMFGKDSK